MFGHPSRQDVGDLVSGATSQFFDRFLRKKRRVRCRDDPVIGKERVGQVGGFRVKDVEGEASNPVALESLPGGGVVDQSAT